MSTAPTRSNASATKTQRIADASSDNVLFDEGVCQAIYIGGTGTLVTLDADGNVKDTFENCQVGTIIPIQAWGVSSTSDAISVTAMFNY